uniref:Uncharacterized protein n=1 Tax=Arundo donax TaxID=35708 RepID=A0A0A9H5C1_ARUDO
MLRLTPATRR